MDGHVLSTIDLNANTSQSSRPPLKAGSKLPTPASKRGMPGLTSNAVPDVKRSRLDLSNRDADATGQSKAHSRMRRSQSVCNIRAAQGTWSSSSTFSSLKPAASTLSLPKPPVRPVAPVPRLAKAPSVASVAPIKSRNMPAPKAVPTAASKPGRRPAWDVKGRLEDSEAEKSQLYQRIESLEGEKDLNGRTLQSINDRLLALEHHNKHQIQVIKEKENNLNEKSSEAESFKKLLHEKEDYCKRLEEELTVGKNALKRLEAEVETYKGTISQLTASQFGIKAENEALKLTIACANNKIAQLETSGRSLEADVETLKATILEKDQKLREAETLRRIQHNQIQELKGNIRVFCRVRPLLPAEKKVSKSITVNFQDQDQKSVELVSSEPTKGRNAERLLFTFDKVFDVGSTQEEVFFEISQLVQSVLDGYNVCVFAYGQTGSGKTFTMEGPEKCLEEQAGMIPRAVEQIFKAISDLEPKGWKYTMEAQFMEVYNETIRDLLGNPKIVQKCEIKMVDSKSLDVQVTNMTTVTIKSEDQVFKLIRQAQNNRAVASTKCNNRSSRSHSIFQLKLSGTNNVTTETCLGTLNLVDLAGSERLKESNAEGERLGETIKINQSLSTLGQVILAKHQNQDHIPYRSSKLTHLLANSLTGNSKTLMFVNISPKEEHLGETLISLRFATRVNSCHIGTAQKKSK